MQQPNASARIKRIEANRFAGALFQQGICGGVSHSAGRMVTDFRDGLIQFEGAEGEKVGCHDVIVQNGRRTFCQPFTDDFSKEHLSGIAVVPEDIEGGGIYWFHYGFSSSLVPSRLRHQLTAFRMSR